MSGQPAVPTAQSDALSYRLIFPTAIYKVLSTIDLTGVRNLNTVIDGQGSIIYGATKGSPIVDAINSRWLKFKDIMFEGDNTNPPNIGLQIGVGLVYTNGSGVVVSDVHHLENITFNGTFSLCCFYNRGGETSLITHMVAYNAAAPAMGAGVNNSTYCVINDGSNFFGVNSVALPIAGTQAISGIL